MGCCPKLTMTVDGKESKEKPEKHRPPGWGSTKGED